MLPSPLVDFNGNLCHDEDLIAKVFHTTPARVHGWLSRYLLMPFLLVSLAELDDRASLLRGCRRLRRRHLDVHVNLMRLLSPELSEGSPGVSHWVLGRAGHVLSRLMLFVGACDCNGLCGSQIGLFHRNVFKSLRATAVQFMWPLIPWPCHRLQFCPGIQKKQKKAGCEFWKMQLSQILSYIKGPCIFCFTYSEMVLSNADTFEILNICLKNCSFRSWSSWWWSWIHAIQSFMDGFIKCFVKTRCKTGIIVLHATARYLPLWSSWKYTIIIISQSTMKNVCGKKRTLWNR